MPRREFHLVLFVFLRAREMERPSARGI